MPDPVPALPDTERISSHTISGVGPYNVGFDLYGDSTDYENWIEVYDDGVKLTVTTDWTLDSPSGSLSSLPRPIDDARVTLVSAARSGTLKIVGARRPRRTTQHTEGIGVTARATNQYLTDIVAILREFWHGFTRTVRVPPGETMALLDPIATRAGKYAKFEAVTGDLVPGGDEDDIEAGAVAAAESASEAATSASNAASSASSASSSASSASTSASTATTQATNAATSATQAAAAVAAVAWKFTWSTGTGGSPASGVVAVNNASPASATELHISETDANGNAIAAEQTRWGAAVNALGRSRIKIAKDEDNFLLLTIVSARTDNGTNSTFTVQDGALTGSLSNSDTVYVAADVSGADGSGLSNIVEDTTPQLGGTLDTNAKQVRYSKGADVASPAGGNLTLGTDGNYFDITGTNAITSIDTMAVGTVVKLQFDGALTLTHHSTDLVLPGGANITTAAGDEAEFVEYATGDWRCTNYSKADPSATSSVEGLVELATAAETTTGTDTARAITPDALAGSDYGKAVIPILVFDDSENCATGDGAGDVFFRVPATLNGYDLVAVAAHVQTAGTTNTMDIQIHNVTQAADMLTTKITIDTTEKDSKDAATPAVIDASNDDVATGDEIRIDVDAVHTTPAKGLLVELTFRLP